jgi:hypothetical protein
MTPTRLTPVIVPAKPQVSIHTLAHYEICGAWWPAFVSWGPLQNLVASYFAWKVKRKYRRYLQHLEMTEKFGRL